MCIIGYHTNKPERSLLAQMEATNRDGNGIAWREDGKVRFAKGITLDQMMEVIEVKEAPFVTHFRIATVGGTRKDLTHPFPYGGDLSLTGTVDAVLAHNGHWSGWKDGLFATLPHAKMPGGAWSDSRAMAYMVGVFGEQVLNLISDGDQKIVTFTADEAFLYGSWVDHDEHTQLSHALWRPVVTTKGKPYEIGRTVEIGQSTDLRELNKLDDYESSYYDSMYNNWADREWNDADDLSYFPSNRRFYSRES